MHKANLSGQPSVNPRGSPGRRPRGDELNIAVAIPLQGSAGIYGPSCQISTQLAVEELNAASGIAGRQVHTIEVDAGQSPARVAADLGRLVAAGEVDAVVGWHISAVRKAVIDRIAGQVPYVYTALYEGGEHSSEVFVTGETPSTQLRPAMTWLRDELALRRWFVVGNDYVWPRQTARAARSFAGTIGCSIAAERHVPLGTQDFTTVLDTIERTVADGVLMLLVGQDMVHFNRQFSARGLDRELLRFSTIMDENALLGIGARATRGLYAAAGYFASLTTADSLDFVGRTATRFGEFAPTCSSVGESCYEGILLLSQLLGARERDCDPLMTAANRLRYQSPRGEVRLDANHLVQTIYLAAADGVEFDVRCQLS